MQAIIKGLAMKALWQVNALKRFGKKLILFLDEPYLGCFGSGFTPLTRESVVAVLRGFTEAIRSENLSIGVHCCGNTDWSIFTDVPYIDIINFDAFGYQDKFVLYADNLKGFLERGGMICWGIVPTQEFEPSLAPGLLIKKIEEGFKRLSDHGIARELLARGLMLSPACGLGALDPAKTQGIFKLLSETALLIGRR
jgi:methionine synthase II (cobalamin-independent)